MLEGILTRGKAPGYIFPLLLILYVLASVLVNRASRSEAVFMLAGKVLPVSVLPGVLTPMANLCIIFLVVFYRRPGFYTSLAILLLQFPLLLRVLIRQSVLSTLPGIFSNLLTIIAILLIFRKEEKAAAYQDMLRDQAVIDTLTGLPNRFGCTSLLNQLVQSGERFVIASVDLYKFKSINDTMGHDAGNSVLAALAERWKTLAEAKDAETLDFVARLSGDEFAIVLRDYDTEETVLKSLRRYVGELERTITVDECDYHLQASFGYAAFPEDADTSDGILTCADVALNEARRLGAGTRVFRFTKDMLSYEKTLRLEQKIRDALEQDTFFFHLQPQYDFSHELRGFEVLARMRDTDGRMISPTEFIPVAEEAGLVDQIDRAVFRKAAISFGQLLKKTRSEITMSVNVSVQHLMKNGFVDEVRKVVEESGVPAGQIELEITESVMIDSAEKALDCINRLKRMGLKIAIDDFGTGYSSLSYLKQFPSDLLKVDKSFVDEMNTSDSSRQYVSAIISIGHIMNQKVIAEGVEEDEQLETLRSIGCDYVQGFIWGRPMLPEEAEKLLA